MLGVEGVPPSREGKMPSILGQRVGRHSVQQITTCLVGQCKASLDFRRDPPRHTGAVYRASG